MRLNKRSLRDFPSSLFARMALIVLLGLLSAQTVSIWLQTGERADAVSLARGLNHADQIAEIVWRLEATNATQRAAVFQTLQSQNLRVVPIEESQVSLNVPRGQIRGMIGARLGSEREIRSPGGAGGPSQRGSGPRSFDVRLQDGQWIRISPLADVAPPTLPANLITRLLITLAIVVVVVMYAVRQVSRPLQQLAEAADQLGQNLAAPPLAEQGSAETRQAARAFNRMQERIHRLIDERARALAAVSHDLRTPLTRLRLRTELLDDENLRSSLTTDLDAMATMLDATLDYLRGLQESEPIRRIDMNALLQTMAEDAEVLGKKIGLEGKAKSPYAGRLSALRRALQNLIDNAFKYGGSAQILIEDGATELRIAVIDKGPGIPPEELDRVTDAYYRPDISRNTETGGVGLGLSIVKDIALMHGGNLVLRNRPDSGFCATLILPRTHAE